MTKSESAHITAQTVLLESAEQVLQLGSAAGVRLAIPDTNNLIMVGPADWIAANVPGVEAMVDMEARKDAAYLERNQVVAALAKCFPSGVARTAIEGWSEDWHGCVYIDMPTGQASWHFHDSQAYLFDGLPPYVGHWDGHTTEEKYARIARLAATTQASTAQAEPGIVSALSAALDHAREALRFYAEQQHFHMHQPGEWDTVSGEPQNYYEDCNNTATVEDGTVAKQVLEDIAFTGRIAAATSSTDAQAAAEVRDTRDATQLADLILADPDGGTMRISSELTRDHDGAMRFTVTNPETGRRFGVYLGLAELTPVRSAGDTDGAQQPLTRCAASRDGDCSHAQCPQKRDNEPATSARHCPLDNHNEED